MAYQSEIEKLEQRYRENPQQWFAALADSYRKAGDLELALEVIRVGLEKRPNYVSGHIVKGRCLMDQKKDPDASAAFQRVLELDAENVIALKALSEISERAGGLDDARRWLSRLLEVDPMNEEAQEALSRLPAAPPSAAQAPAPALEDTLSDARAELAPKIEALGGLEPTALDDEPRPAGKPARASGSGFVIEKAEEAMASMDTAEMPPAADLESTEFTLPDRAAAQQPEGLRELPDLEPDAAPERVAEPKRAPEPAPEPEIEPEPEPEPVAGSGDALPLIFPEEERPAETAETAETAEPEPVVTETMAELYAKQGLMTEARDIYRQLVARRPADGGLARRLAELEGAPGGGPARRTSGRGLATGGPTVRDFLGDVFSGRREAPAEPPAPDPSAGSEAPTPMDTAFAEPEPGDAVRGEPTRPALDEMTLASVFGEEPPPVSSRPSRPSGAQASPEEKFSFDEFFGATPTKKPPPATRPSQSEPEKEPGTDEDDFKRWLKGLKS